MKTIKSV